MKTNAERFRDKRRFELERMRREIKAYDDAVQREARKSKTKAQKRNMSFSKKHKERMQTKIRKEVDEFLAKKAARLEKMKANPIPKSSTQIFSDTEEAASKKKKTTSEFRNGGVVDLGDFKGSF